MEATVRHLSVYEIKVNVERKIEMFEQALCKVVSSVYLIVLQDENWGTFPSPGIVKQKAWKSALQATLMGTARLPEPTQHIIETYSFSLQ